MSEENKEEQQGDEERTDKTEYFFHPDSAIKMFLKEISTPRLLRIINYLCGTNYPTDSTVDFGSTEHFKVLGDLEKNLVRGDFVTTVKTENHQETTNKIIIELQSTRDKTMGFRMFVYSLNVADEDEESQTYTFPKGVTIYTTDDKKKVGTDELHMIIEKFRVGDIEYSSAKGDRLTVSFPFINVLAMDFEEFQNSPLELLKVIYPYRYRKNPKLMKKTEELKRVMESVRDFTLNETGKDRMVINQILADILKDLIEVCKEKNYYEELNLMENLYKSHSHILVEEAEARTEARVKLQEKLTIAKNLIGKIPNFEIANVTGLPLTQVEQL